MAESSDLVSERAVLVQAPEVPAEVIGLPDERSAAATAPVAHEDTLIQLSPDQFLTSVGPTLLMGRMAARAIVGAFVCLTMAISMDCWYFIAFFIDGIEAKWFTKCITGGKKFIYHADSDTVELPLHTMHKAHKSRPYLTAAVLLGYAVVLAVALYGIQSPTHLQLLFPLMLIGFEIFIQYSHRKKPRQYLEKCFKDANGFPHLDKHVEFDM